MTYTIAVCTVKTHDVGQRNCPKHVEFYSKIKFEKLVQLVGFVIRIYHDARSPERQKSVLNWTVSIPLCTYEKFIELNRLYTTQIVLCKDSLIQ